MQIESALRMLRAAACVVGLAGCMTTPTVNPSSTPCTADSSRIGQSASLRTYFHGVRGTVRIVDDCTLAIENFSYDGGGLDVRVYGGRDRSFNDGIILSNDLRRPGGYDNETLTVKLPAGVTLDEIHAVAIWCIVVNANFGDAEIP